PQEPEPTIATTTASNERVTRYPRRRCMRPPPIPRSKADEVIRRLPARQSTKRNERTSGRRNFSTVRSLVRDEEIRGNSDARPIERLATRGGRGRRDPRAPATASFTHFPAGSTD